MIPKTFSEEDLKETFKVKISISRSNDAGQIWPECANTIEIVLCVSPRSMGTLSIVWSSKINPQARVKVWVMWDTTNHPKLHRPSRTVTKVRLRQILAWIVRQSQPSMTMMLLPLAYRAILAEPRIKASSTEDYSGATSRSDYMGGGDTMTPYPPPLRMQPFKDKNTQSCIYIQYIFNVALKSEIYKYTEKMCIWRRQWTPATTKQWTTAQENSHGAWWYQPELPSPRSRSLPCLTSFPEWSTVSCRGTPMGWAKVSHDTLIFPMWVTLSSPYNVPLLCTVVLLVWL